MNKREHTNRENFGLILEVGPNVSGKFKSLSFYGNRGLFTNPYINGSFCIGIGY